MLLKVSVPRTKAINLLQKFLDTMTSMLENEKIDWVNYQKMKAEYEKHSAKLMRTKLAKTHITFTFTDSDIFTNINIKH